MKFAVVDVETTGGDPERDALTEIGIAILEDNRCIKTYNKLINPRCDIPLNIRVLTGITPEMTANAPGFEEIAEEVYELLNGNIFTAHNVKFDYAFVKSAFKRAGMDFTANKKVCTVKYTRQVVPGLKNYKLSNLCRRFEITNDHPHRALNDALAAADILRRVQKLDRKNLLTHMLKYKSREVSVPQYLESRHIEALPESVGIYRFLNRSEKLVYVGKARNIKKRVKSHFSGTAFSSLYQNLNREVADVQFALSGSETVAALMEDHEIRRHWPLYNRAQKRNPVYYGVYAYRDNNDYYRLGINRVRNNYPPLKKFHSLYNARKWLLQQIETFELHPGLCHMDFLVSSGGELEIHNERFDEMRKALSHRSRNTLIAKPGRTPDEQALIYLENDHYKGVGFISRELDFRSEPERAVREIIPMRSSIITDKVIENELFNSHPRDVLHFKGQLG